MSESKTRRIRISIRSRQGSAEALGTWGVAGFIGTYIGPMIGGAALEIFGKTENEREYSYSGYFALLTDGAFICFLCGFVTSFIKGAK